MQGQGGGVEAEGGGGDERDGEENADEQDGEPKALAGLERLPTHGDRVERASWRCEQGVWGHQMDMRAFVGVVRRVNLGIPRKLRQLWLYIQAADPYLDV